MAESTALKISPPALGSILVPVDFSENASQAIKQAVALAKVFSSKVHVLHVYREKPNWADQVVTPLTLGYSAKNFDLLLSEAAKLMMEKFLAPFLGDDIQITSAVVQGKPVEVVLSEAQKGAHDLVIMGRKGTGDIPHIVLGSTSERVLRKIECPLLIVSEQSDTELKKLVVPTDFYEASEDALRYGIGLAQRLQAQVVALHVYEPLIKVFRDYALTPENHVEKVKDPGAKLSSHYEQCMEDFLAPYRDQSISDGIEIQSKVIEGQAWDEINQIAEQPKPGIIVMGAYAKQGLEKLILGSVTEKVVKFAHCPVLILKV